MNLRARRSRALHRSLQMVASCNLQTFCPSSINFSRLQNMWSTLHIPGQIRFFILRVRYNLKRTHSQFLPLSPQCEALEGQTRVLFCFDYIWHTGKIIVVTLYHCAQWLGHMVGWLVRLVFLWFPFFVGSLTVTSASASLPQGFLQDGRQMLYILLALPGDQDWRAHAGYSGWSGKRIAW